MTVHRFRSSSPCRRPGRNAANSTDALNPPFTALGESTRASAPNARQFVRLGFGDRFGAQAPVSAQAPGRAASFFRAVERKPRCGRLAASENKEPRRSGAGGGTSFGVFGPPWGRGSRGGSRFALIRTISHRPRRGCDGHHILCDCRLGPASPTYRAPLAGRACLSVLRNIDLDQSLFPTYSRGRIFSKAVDGTSVGGAGFPRPAGLS
jgi:hypothetical protein